MKNQSRSYIHYDLDRIDYSLTGEELEMLKNSCQNNWKDFCIGCFALGIPCLLNAISTIYSQTKFDPTLPIVLNLIIGISCIILSFAFFCAWYKTKIDIDEFIDKIKNKPKVSITPSMTDIGELSAGPIE
ncbi:MAG: hypothetical protein ABIC04_07900 [Nanoarchaeota archaeon]